MATRLWLNGDSDATQAVSDFIHTLAKAAALPRRKTYWLRLAAEEITTNIIEHGYEGAGPVWLDSGVQPRLVWVKIEDEAPAFDPMTHDHHFQLAIEPTQREEGGFGLLLAMHKLDDFTYEYVNGKNRNTLIMHRTDGGADGEINRPDRR
jgi:serine/threonine-protein kinase RsbW